MKERESVSDAGTGWPAGKCRDCGECSRDVCALIAALQQRGDEFSQEFTILLQQCLLQLLRGQRRAEVASNGGWSKVPERGAPSTSVKRQTDTPLGAAAEEGMVKVREE